MMNGKRNVVSLLSMGFVVGIGVDTQAQSFSLDDNPAAPIASGIGTLPGLGAEDEFGFTFPGGGFALAPSPSIVASLPVVGPLGDGTIFSGTIGGLQFAPNGSYIDAFSTNHPSSTLPIGIDFSVDRLTVGPAGSAVGFEALGSQQPGDIFGSTASFTSPAAFVGALLPGPYAGPLPTAGSAPGGSNALLIDESALGLTVVGIPGALTPSGVAVAPPIPASHDNVDAFDYAVQTPFAVGGVPLGVYSADSYFAISPDEAAAVGVSPGDLFVVPAGAPGTALAPYAFAPMLGLFPGEDSVDALVMFDVGLTPSDGASIVDPGLDYALFSLAPGSLSLALFGLSGDEVFFTDFTGAFATYAFPTDIGLFPGGSSPFTGDNVDALEITIIPEPSTLLLAAIPLLGMISRRRKRA